jgi:hypothetical protein
MSQTIKSYFSFIWKCLGLAFWSSWDSANNLAGNLIVAFIGGGMLNAYGFSAYLSTHTNVALAIYTGIAWIFLMIVRAIFISPFILCRESEKKIAEFENKAEREAKIENLNALYKEGINIRARFKVFNDDVEWKPWGGDMDDWKGRITKAGYNISVALGARIDTPNMYFYDVVTTHQRSREQYIEIWRVLNVVERFFEDESKQEQRNVTR